MHPSSRMARDQSLRKLREKGGRMPAIALSGYGQEQDVRQSIMAGFSAHLVKPTDLQKLRETIAAVMGRRG